MEAVSYTMCSQPKILFLTQAGGDLPSVRFRVSPYVQLGRESGWRVDSKRIPKSFFERIRFIHSLERYHFIIIQKKLFSALEPSLLKRKCTKLFFDFDDAIWTSHPSVAPGPKRDARELKDKKRFFRQCSQVDAVIAGNSYLAAKAGEVSNNISIVPTPLDTDEYRLGEFNSGVPTVGWMGTSSNLFFLEDILDGLRPVLSENPAFIVSNKKYAGSGKELVNYEDWSSENEVRQLQSMDIGLMPLTDDEYTRGKCGFKLLQYMACGAVPIASDVGFNREIIEDGRDGFLIKSQSEWLDRVKLLTNDTELRMQMREAARDKVVSKFSLNVVAERLWESLGIVNS
jgi:glycosyltransferase involved in cell wall biosynthesis